MESRGASTASAQMLRSICLGPPAGRMQLTIRVDVVRMASKPKHARLSVVSTIMHNFVTLVPVCAAVLQKSETRFDQE